MASEYLNNKNLEKTIIIFQKAKRDRKLYNFLQEDIKKREDKVKIELKDSVNKKVSEIANIYEVTQNNLAIGFYTLSENIVRYAKFNLIDIDDAIQEGVLVCFEKLDRFNPKIGKAFNYMTTCILNHFKQLYRSARNYNELKKRYQDFMMREVENEICCSRTPRRTSE
jgi:DNA-directed RNA polymerase specialized sigma subunit